MRRRESEIGLSRLARCAGIACAGLLAAAAASAAPRLDLVLEALPTVVTGEVVSIEVREFGAQPVYLVATSLRGDLYTQQVRSDAKAAKLEPVGEATYRKGLSPAARSALSRSRLSLLQLVRRGQGIARGFEAREAEYEVEGGRLVAEIELLRRGVALEIVLDAASGEVIGVELEGDDDHLEGEDEDEEEDEEEDDDAFEVEDDDVR